MENALSLGLALGLALLPLVAMIRRAARPVEVRVPVRVSTRGRR